MTPPTGVAATVAVAALLVGLALWGAAGDGPAAWDDAARSRGAGIVLMIVAGALTLLLAAPVNSTAPAGSPTPAGQSTSPRGHSTTPGAVAPRPGSSGAGGPPGAAAPAAPPSR